MVFICNLNDDISRSSVHLICCVGIYIYLIVILIQSISIRCVYFLNAVMPDFKILRKDQISLLICKIGFMFYRSRISRYLLHIFFSVHVENLELCILLKHCFLCLVILFDDFQLRFKLFIQHHSPHLRSAWMVLCNLHNKIIYRSIVMRSCCLTDNIRSIRDRNTAGITFLVCKDFCSTVFSDHYWFGRIKIITAIFIYFQGRHQISGKSCPFQ